MIKNVVGMFGDVCAGKSTIAGIFRSYFGAAVYDADKAVHALYEQDRAVQAAIRAEFGDEVFWDGNINRKALARIVFGAPERLLALTNIVNPILRMQVGELVAAFRASSEPILLMDAPTLCHVGLDAVCDRLVRVTADPLRRQEWAAKRGWSADELARRDVLIQCKTCRKHHVISNNYGIEEAKESVAKLVESWSRDIDAPKWAIRQWTDEGVLTLKDRITKKEADKIQVVASLRGEKCFVEAM